ncbi:hypothetical protein [Flavobacterium sp. HJJ]|uniref:hypothetical protein n=1 Tax=Flavobacterium sp. HJJ TaxID=2783792 RepID=UPI00188CDACF|nr:hypothetical protein [Flavobacterium sp. HJJ]MBF4471886.1 hypothetical protein [Flavobacterium sp. HJJ]
MSSFIVAGGTNFAVGIYRAYSSNGVSSNLHAVVITGITADGSKYICSDSQNGVVIKYIDIDCIEKYTGVSGL